MTAVYVFVGMSTLMCIVAACACLFAWRGCSRSYSTKRFTSLEAAFTDLRGSQDELLATWQRFRSAEGMREIRERRRMGADPGVTDVARDPPGRARVSGDSKHELRRHLGVPDSPLAAALKGTRVAD